MAVLKVYILRNTKTGRWFKSHCRARDKNYGKITTTTYRDNASRLAGLEYTKIVQSRLSGNWERVFHSAHQHII